MRRFPIVICLAFLFLLAQPGISSAATPETTAADATTAALTATTATVTATATTAATTTTPEPVGGSVYIETDPPGATIWVDGFQIGTSDTTYFSEKTGMREVTLRRRGYEEYRGAFTVEEGKRIVFYAKLTPLPRTVFDEDTPTLPVTAATTIRKSTLTIPTPWPTSPQSPVEPGIAIAAAVSGIGLLVIRRR